MVRYTEVYRERLFRTEVDVIFEVENMSMIIMIDSDKLAVGTDIEFVFIDLKIIRIIG